MWYLAYFLIHLIVYTLLRLEFLVWNWSSLSHLTAYEIFIAFLAGLRFDLSALAPILGLTTLGLIWGAQNKIFKVTWYWLFLALNTVFILINFVDLELYNFTAKRFAWSSLFLVSEGHASNLVLPYLPLASASFLILGLFIFFSYKTYKKINFQWSIPQKIGATFSAVILAALCSRGGFQVKPITFVDAKIFTNSYANNLVLNSTFTFLKSATHESLSRSQFFSQDEMLKQLNQEMPVTVQVPNNEKLNIMVLILESFSKEYTELHNPEATPFINKLRAEGVDFKNSYSNGRRSIEGVAAILSGIPALMEEPFINSEFSANQIIGLGQILSSHGYETAFFHAASTGSMHFDSFSKSVGIEKYFGKEAYPNKGDDDGTWGIYDEPFMQWACEKMTGFKKPFFTTLFTLSSHQPYTLPAKYLNRFKDDRAPILKSVEYTDYSIEQFMKCAEKQDWFKNTLFIITADHTGPELQANSSFISRFQVPIIFYGPHIDWLKNLNTEQAAQHIDLLPTILDILGIEQKNVNYLSRSLLRPGDKLVALYSDGKYELAGQVKNPDQQLKAV
ncbi:MAG: LTA synthase family protein, partial [Pseudobdellovibrio sp.]